MINFKNDSYPYVKQKNQMDCGIACVSMITQYFGKKINYTTLEDESFISKEGVTFENISDLFSKFGIENVVVKFDFNTLIQQAEMPCILHWNLNHFIVLYSIKRKLLSNKYIFIVADPAHGIITLNQEDFINAWIHSQSKGFAMFVEPTEFFFNLHDTSTDSSFIHIIKYLKPFRWNIAKIFLTLILSSLLTLIFPFLTEKLVDDGINPKDLGIVSLILIGQLSLFFGQTVMEIIRNRVSLFIGSRININIISDFLAKLMQMPLKYFDSKMIGDLAQRIQDHKRIENFLTSQSILTLFSLINFSVFFVVLAYYNIFILLIYIGLTFLSVLWVLYFQKRRKNIDYQRFSINAENQEKTYELISGIQEIKLNNFEIYKNKQWKYIQEKLFLINFKVLNIDQLQLSGYDFINNFKNILVTYVVAKNVINDNLTIGAMLSISYIIGEMNAPISHLVNFFRSYQDAKISYSRLEEINNYVDPDISRNEDLVNDINYHSDIIIENLNFRYGNGNLVLHDINFIIPKNKITAIVGVSGSGKTTLLKLLLKYYTVNSGEILLGDVNFDNFKFEEWRQQYGVVMQDGYIFSDTIERNIATSEEVINYRKLENSLRIANLSQLINDLPLGIKTPIGTSGNGLSGGQKQRILIARAVYKNPNYLFFDEASSSLDAENEKLIMDNLSDFLNNRTAVIVAHRLSTVKNADQIIVLKNGRIVEIGNHDQLVQNKGDYFNLIKNQLELGN